MSCPTGHSGSCLSLGMFLKCSQFCYQFEPQFYYKRVLIKKNQCISIRKKRVKKPTTRRKTLTQAHPLSNSRNDNLKSQNQTRRSILINLRKVCCVMLCHYTFCHPKLSLLFYLYSQLIFFTFALPLCTTTCYAQLC